MTDKFQNDIKNLVEEFNFNGQKKFKLIVLFGLLGDFDSFEYAINLKNFKFLIPFKLKFFNKIIYIILEFVSHDVLMFL